jgi:hypothetical protein
MSLLESNDWTRPRALATPKEGYLKLEHGKYEPAQTLSSEVLSRVAGASKLADHVEKNVS